MKLIVAGWAGATVERHLEQVHSALELVVRMNGAVRTDVLDEDMLVVTGGSPRGLDVVAETVAASLGWKLKSWEDARREILPGCGTGNYRAICQDGADLMVLFPGPADTDSLEALRWAVRKRIPFMGFPLGKIGRAS